MAVWGSTGVRCGRRQIGDGVLVLITVTHQARHQFTPAEVDVLTEAALRLAELVADMETLEGEESVRLDRIAPP